MEKCNADAILDDHNRRLPVHGARDAGHPDIIRIALMPNFSCTFARLPLTALFCVLLTACGGDDDEHADAAPPVVSPADPASPATPSPDPASPTPDPEPASPTPDPQPASPYLGARSDDVLKVKISELHPTQAAVGYDQIYYHLARKQPDPGRYSPSGAGYLGDDAQDNYSRYLYRSERKRGQDYCEDNGQGDLNDATYQPHTLRLIDPNTFQCTEPAPEKGSDRAALLKTVVVGPKGVLYLTDGHHTMTVLSELADGGPSLPVWVRVAANYSDAPDMAAFWARMDQSGYVWLRDGQNTPIDPAELPGQVGLANLQDDSLRSLVYLTRGLGYSNDQVPEFAEFLWGSWLRDQGLDLGNYALTALDRARVTVSDGKVAPRPGDATASLVAAVRDAAIRMVSVPPETRITQARSAADLGQLAAPAQASSWNDLLEEDVWRADTNGSGRYRTAGKAWYAVKYRQCGGPAATQPACWLLPVQ